MTAEHEEDWDEMLGPVLFSLRTKPQASTKFSPFFLLYHREAKYPAEMEDFDGIVSYICISSTMEFWLPDLLHLIEIYALVQTKQ